MGMGVRHALLLQPDLDNKTIGLQFIRWIAESASGFGFVSACDTRGMNE
jgi:hypothetical protein